MNLTAAFFSILIKLAEAYEEMNERVYDLTSKALSFENTHIGNEELASLAAALAVNQEVEQLDLSRNYITELSPLRDVLAKNKTLKKLFLYYNFHLWSIAPLVEGLIRAGTASRLEVLDLSRCGLGEFEVHLLGHMLAKNCSLQVLDLRMNDHITSLEPLHEGLKNSNLARLGLPRDVWYSDTECARLQDLRPGLTIC
ncbi:unnamed protein product [Prorocentrum cordatum]|uniref:Uncharacterized protein n=1 Tax=Prorocentrum cordatum TaxID=2364126 RepID=A0ABN9RM95_9DINO|nr:unnamed protein product [Polarella glacialis]